MALKVSSKPVTMAFLAEGHDDLMVLAYLEGGPANANAASRWVFNTQQIAQQNNIPIPMPTPGDPGTPPDQQASQVYANDDTLQVIGKQIVEAVIAARKEADKLRKSVGDVFSAGLPESTPTEGGPEPTPLPAN